MCIFLEIYKFSEFLHVDLLVYDCHFLHIADNGLLQYCIFL